MVFYFINLYPARILCMCVFTVHSVGSEKMISFSFTTIWRHFGSYKIHIHYVSFYIHDVLYLICLALFHLYIPMYVIFFFCRFSMPHTNYSICALWWSLSYMFLCCYQLPRNHRQLNGFCAATGSIQSTSQCLRLCRFWIPSVLQKCHTKEMPLTSLDCGMFFLVICSNFSEIQSNKIFFHTHTILLRNINFITFRWEFERHCCHYLHHHKIV